MWRGELLFIHVAHEGSAPMRELAEADLVAGVGITGTATRREPVIGR